MIELADSLYLRQMEAEDLDQVMLIEKQRYDFCWSREIFQSCFKPSYHCLVLADHDDVYGYAVVLLGAREAHLLNICVAESIRGQGFARKILSAVFDLCHTTQSQELFLEVRPSNHVAVGLYESLGFNEIGVRPNYYKAHQGREDAIVMVNTIL